MISALNIHVGVFEYKWVPHVEYSYWAHVEKPRRAANTELAGQWKKPDKKTVSYTFI